MKKIALPFLLFILLLSCGSSSDTDAATQPINQNGEKAVITSVSVSGNENSYTFSVGIQSPDKGCNQYANWWEVLSENGDLIYRRILAHSHVSEQPFTRSGGNVNVTKFQIVIIRAHMNTSGYGTKTFRGSVDRGFSAFTTENNFATNLESQQPLPSGCAF